MINNGKLLLALILLVFTLKSKANDTTHVLVDLNSHKNATLKIVVNPPSISSEEINFIIPSITPGTYMQINYHRFYSNFKAFDENNNELKITGRKNHISIKNAKQLKRLEYTVEHSLKDNRIWDNTIGCDGTIFKDSSFLLNYQLITGYFKGYQYKPIKVKVRKKDFLYGSTALPKVYANGLEDLYSCSSYDELIDNPMLYAKADTSSFNIEDARFHISVYSETGRINASMLNPKLKRLMKGIKNFCGELASKDYHFIMYFESDDSLKGLLKGFGLGSALEHMNSSVYYLSDDMDTSFKYLNYIGAHEYLHTWAPLNIHSEKIEQFNFDEPDMSKHLWFYEGVTDYLESLVIASQKLPVFEGFSSSLSYALYTAKKRKARSMTESSENIINHNMFDWIGKILQLENFYEKGKFIAFSLDMELYMNSNGNYRLKDLMIDLHAKYKDSNFKDDKFLDELVSLSSPDLKIFMEKYIEGKELPAYKKYFDKMGKTFVNINTKFDSFGELNWWYDKERNRYYVRGKNNSNFETEAGDTINTIKGIYINGESFKEQVYDLFYPQKNAETTITVIRAGKELSLTAKASKKRKANYPYLLSKKGRTQEQKDFYNRFLYLYR